MDKIGLIVTSISKPNKVLGELAQGSLKHQWDFVVIGDVSSPQEFALEGCDFYDIKRQISTGFVTAKECLTKHYARKNIGYLIAIQRGVNIIVETDDDNLPLEGFWAPRTKTRKVQTIDHQGWANVYRYFSDELIWPRGFPLNAIHDKAQKMDSLLKEQKLDCPIQQGLADGNPDVDAIYRLIMPLPVHFKERSDIALAAKTWCPFNSQNTTWFKEAFPLLYLPAYCSFRMTDIWRSLIAQRIAWENGWNVLFHKPTVYQERNEHNLMKDFADEVSGYLQVQNIRDMLEQVTIKTGVENISQALRVCYGDLIKKGIFDTKEMDLLDAWLKDLDGLKGRIS